MFFIKCYCHKLIGNSIQTFFNRAVVINLQFNIIHICYQYNLVYLQKKVISKLQTVQHCTDKELKLESCLKNLDADKVKSNTLFYWI